MVNEDKLIGSTADGLVVLRSSLKARELGIEDPFAEWFISEEGKHLLQLAKNTDRVYEEYNLARYKFTTSKLQKLSRNYKQMLFLGSGFDCRPIWLDIFQDGKITVFEIDEPLKLQQKKNQLKLHGQTLPKWNHFIPSNLENNKIPELLLAKGLEQNKPLLILSEGLFFFVSSQIVKKVLNPNWLGLVAGSRIIFDCWSINRVAGLNTRLFEMIGRNLFHPFPFSTDLDSLESNLSDLGYNNVVITPLANLVEEYYQKSILDECESSWLIIEALV